MSVFNPKDLASFPEWMRHAAEVEVTCLSVAAGGLASELGMMDREQNDKIREALARREASETSPVQP